MNLYYQSPSRCTQTTSQACPQPREVNYAQWYRRSTYRREAVLIQILHFCGVFEVPNSAPKGKCSCTILPRSYELVIKMYVLWGKMKNLFWSGQFNIPRSHWRTLKAKKKRAKKKGSTLDWHNTKYWDTLWKFWQREILYTVFQATLSASFCSYRFFITSSLRSN